MTRCGVVAGAAVTLAAVMTLTGCFTGPREIKINAPVADIVAPECPTDGVGLVIDAKQTGGGRVPDDFVVVRAVRCNVEPHPGATGGMPFEVVQETGPAPADLLDTLGLPDLVGSERGAVCDASQQAFQYLLLVDRDDRAYRTRLPMQQCGRVRAEVGAAMGAIDWRSERSFTVVRPD